MLLPLFEPLLLPLFEPLLLPLLLPDGRAGLPAADGGVGKATGALVGRSVLLWGGMTACASVVVVVVEVVAAVVVVVVSG